MTYKRIVLSPHASERMRKRGVTRAMVRLVLAVGTDFDATVPRGARRRHGREWRIDTRLLRVVYVEDADEITVVTVMWKERR